MKINLPKFVLRAVFAVLACIGLLSTAHATPVNTSQPSATQALMSTPPAMTAQDILNKYLHNAHARWGTCYRRKRHCFSWDYGQCLEWGWRRVAYECRKRHRHYRKRRYRKKRYY